MVYMGGGGVVLGMQHATTYIYASGVVTGNPNAFSGSCKGRTSTSFLCKPLGCFPEIVTIWCAYIWKPFKLGGFTWAAVDGRRMEPLNLLHGHGESLQLNKRYLLG